MIFSPGDFVYSSSKFLGSYLPPLNIEKLSLLMDSKINFNDLKKHVINSRTLKFTLLVTLLLIAIQEQHLLVDKLKHQLLVF